jgi:hypothetical protein
MSDPFWSVNPLEAISKSFSVLVFAPFDYIGDKLGKFLGGIIGGIPFWLQPLLLLFVFGFFFMSIFGYRIVCPFFTIEPVPVRPYYLEQSRGMNAIEPANRPVERNSNELLERPERKIMKSIKDASTDMDDFENYLNGYPEPEATDLIDSGSWLSRIMNILRVLLDVIRDVLDAALRQVPDRNHEFPDDEDGEQLVRGENADDLFEQPDEDAAEENLAADIPDVQNREELEENINELEENINELFHEPNDHEPDDILDEEVLVMPRRRMRRSRNEEDQQKNRRDEGEQAGD